MDLRLMRMMPDASRAVIELDGLAVDGSNMLTQRPSVWDSTMTRSSSRVTIATVSQFLGTGTPDPSTVPLDVVPGQRSAGEFQRRYGYNVWDR